MSASGFIDRETPTTLARERAVADDIERRMGCVLVKLPRMYGFDFIAIRDDRPVAWVELKTRTCASDAFETIMIAARKLIRAREYERSLGLPVWFIVKWTDRMGAVRLDNCKIELGYGGMVGRGDPSDQEPLAFISTGDFRWLTEPCATESRVQTV